MLLLLFPLRNGLLLSLFCRYHTSCRTGGWPTGEYKGDVLLFLLQLCNFVLFLLIRADNQESLSSNITVIQNGKNITEQLDTDFYLGIYGGNMKMNF